MILIPKAVFAQYLAFLKMNNVPVGYHSEYVKWLRYFLDFCAKYVIVRDKSERVRLFLGKLREKNQTQDQCKRAAHAVSLYFAMQRPEPTPQATAVQSDLQPTEAAKPPCSPQSSEHQRKSQYNEAGYQEKSDSPEWDAVLAAMAAEIKVRHYSRKTLQTYAKWSRQFQRFLKSKPPEELTDDDVKDYLTWLAVKCNVAASTQNQAFNSLLFLLRHALKRDFGELRDVPRAKKSLYVPVVLSRAEIDAILANLYHPYGLIVKLLFGCGLRLFECLQLRVRDFRYSG
ncbi:hypothetical protein EG832_02250 [bacterium]|nr:hypothetical protein [bacterium]